MIRASRNPDVFLNLIGGLAFRQPRLTHDHFDTVQLRRKNWDDRDGDARTKSPDRKQYFVVTNDQSCAGVERAEMSVSSPTEELATVSADEHLGPYIGQCGDYSSLMSVQELTEMTTRIRNRFTLSQIASVAMAETRTRRPSRSQCPSLPWADCRMDSRVNRFRRRSRLLRGYSAADGCLWNSRSCWTGAALGDAKSAPCVAAIDSQGVFRHVDRRSHHSLLLHCPVLRPALDFRPPPCHICPHRAVSCCGCSFI